MNIRESEENATIDCPRCNCPNPADLIYCANPDCIAVLYDGRVTCGACRAVIPVNARFCPDCGHSTECGKVSDGFTFESVQ